MPLSERVRANSEAAPWVIYEIAKLESELENAHRALDALGVAKGNAHSVDDRIRLLAADCATHIARLLDAVSPDVDWHERS